MKLKAIYGIMIASVSCGQNNSSSNASELQFGIVAPYTAETSNEIFITGATKLKVKLENLGEPFEPSIPLGEMVPAPERISVNYMRKAQYSAMLSVFSDDGTLLAKDKIGWIHDYVVPPKPIVGFSENATNDSNVLLLFASNRGPLTKRAWIKGDVGGKFLPEGSLHEIPPDGRLPLSLSPGDGMKQVFVKLRNEYGVDSEESMLKILQKSLKPNDCQAAVASTLVAKNLVRIKLEGRDPESLYFGVQGDTAEFITFKKFVSGEIFDVQLSEGYGDKKITILVRDEAENYCLRKNFTITVSEHAVESSLSVIEPAVFTDQRIINLQLQVQDFPNSNLEMMLLGHITGSGSQWVPYSPAFKVELTPGEGQKVIEAFVRPIGGTKAVFQAKTDIFFKPFAYKKTTSQGTVLVFNEYWRIKQISVSGCKEGGENIKPLPNLLCTPDGNKISVTYHYDNGTSVTLTP